MGQQQLLLIILGVLIVGSAIWAGLALFNTGSITVNRDAMVNDMNIVASSAQQHFLRPAALGGGGGTFTGYELPARLRSTGNGEYRVNGDGRALEIVGESVLHNDVSITLTVSVKEDGFNYEWDWEHEGL